MFTLSPSDTLTVITALRECAAEHSHQSQGVNDNAAITAERYRAIASDLKAQFDRAFPLTVR